MSRYVDIDTLKIPSEEMIAKWIVNSAPSINIVLCSECKYWHKNRKAGDGMNVFDICYDFQADDFCSYGERSEL